MIKVDIKLGNKTWKLEKPLDLKSSDNRHFNAALKNIQRQTNGILTQLIEEDCVTGDKEISESESGTDEDGDIQPKTKRKKQ